MVSVQIAKFNTGTPGYSHYPIQLLLMMLTFMMKVNSRKICGASNSRVLYYDDFINQIMGICEICGICENPSAFYSKIGCFVLSTIKLQIVRN